jgi:hypothetical protein
MKNVLDAIALEHVNESGHMIGVGVRGDDDIY